MGEGGRSGEVVHLYRRQSGQWLNEETVSVASRLSRFGMEFAANGSLLAVGTAHDTSEYTGVHDAVLDGTLSNAGAVHLFSRTDDAWSPGAYVKASNTEAGDEFGHAVALARDGSRLAVGAPGEDGSAIGIGGDPASNNASDAGAAYLY